MQLNISRLVDLYDEKAFELGKTDNRYISFHDKWHYIYYDPCASNTERRATFIELARSIFSLNVLKL